MSGKPAVSGDQVIAAIMCLFSITLTFVLLLS